MAKYDEPKLRVIAVYRILERGERVSTRTIMRELERRYGIEAERKTIMDDVRAISRIMPIDSVPGRYGGYRKIDVLKECELYDRGGKTMFDCAHIDEWGFCKLYSDVDVVVRCPKNADCDKYVEEEK